jgi:hypothetical protein
MRKILLLFLLLPFFVSCSGDDEESDENVVLCEVYSENPSQKLKVSLGDSWSKIVTGRWESAVRTDKSECYVFADNYYEGLSPITDERPYVYAKVYVNGKLRTMTQSKSGVNFYVALKKSSSYWNQQKDSFLDLKGKSFTK